MQYDYYESPVGPILMAADDKGIRYIHFSKGKSACPLKDDWQHEPAALAACALQLEEYFAGDRKEFTLPLAPVGTEFQQAVWHQLQHVRYGNTASYGEIAKALGKPEASRAVGAANGKNPVPILIPCHRILGTSGKLTGYAGGVDIKKHLLQLEQVSGFLL